MKEKLFAAKARVLVDIASLIDSQSAKATGFQELIKVLHARVLLCRQREYVLSVGRAVIIATLEDVRRLAAAGARVAATCSQVRSGVYIYIHHQRPFALGHPENHHYVCFFLLVLHSHAVIMQTPMTSIEVYTWVQWDSVFNETR